ncbi:hypothetical protein [Streptomyces xanthophaeus]|uniref:hypothetical protein n=1 Tax=Streptomyces xanthophaeus TaxID=67385 RepID=UPI0037179D7B
MKRSEAAMLPQSAKSIPSARHLTRTAALAAAVAIAAVVGVPASAAPAAAPTSAASVAAAPSTNSPIVGGQTTLGLNPKLGLAGSVSLKVGGGKVTHADHKITGGQVLLNGQVTLKAGGKNVTLSKLSIDIANGTVTATLNRSAVVLATIDTSTLRLRSQPGSTKLYVHIGFADDNNIELSGPGAAKLNALLGLKLTKGDTLLDGEVAVALNLDEALAADLGVDLKAAVEAGIDSDVELGAPIDLDA